MHIKQLEYVQEIATCHSITKAAQNLYISQQALSEALKLLENELGFALFIRSNKGVKLTPSGEKILHDLDVIIPLIHKWKQLSVPIQRKNVKIIVQYILSDLISNGHLMEYLSELNQFSFDWDTNDVKNMITQLKQDKFHLGILHVTSKSKIFPELEQLKSNPHFAVEKIKDSQMVIVSRSTDISPQKTLLTPSDLFGKQLVQNKGFGNTPVVLQLEQYTKIPKIIIPESASTFDYILCHENTICWLPELILKNNIYVQNGTLTLHHLTENFQYMLYLVYDRFQVEPIIVEKIMSYFS